MASWLLMAIADSREEIMDSAVFIETPDESFAEIISRTLKIKGIPTRSSEDGRDILTHLADCSIGVVLLDIRNHYEKALNVLRAIKHAAPETEVLLINRPYNIWIAVEGMRAGASDEITVPLDTEALAAKVTEARIRAASAKKAARKNIFRSFSNAMSAATFAQAGEFDTAIRMLEADRKENESDDGSGQ
ncbi:MAG: response regulator [Thermodesulfobacteriota bacterium]